MSYRTYTPKRGDLVHLNFSPSAGHELADRHYALVLSADSYNRKSRMAVVCGITSHVHDWPFEVLLPATCFRQRLACDLSKASSSPTAFDRLITVNVNAPSLPLYRARW